MFSQRQIDELIAEFPGRPVLETIARIQVFATTNTVTSPMGLARSWIRTKPASATSRTTPPSGKPPERHRGSFRTDGSWNPESEHESATERALREILATVVRMRLDPSSAREVIASVPSAAGVLRPYRQPAVVEPGLAGLIATWHCAHAATSAEEWFKRRVINGLAQAAVLEGHHGDAIADHSQGSD